MPQMNDLNNQPLDHDDYPEDIGRDPEDIDDAEDLDIIFEGIDNDPDDLFSQPPDYAAVILEALLNAGCMADAVGIHAPDTLVQPCVKCSLHSIEVVVIDDMDEQIAGVAIDLLNDAGQILRRASASQRSTCFQGLDSGPFHLSLPFLDQDAWEIIDERTTTIAQVLGREADWNLPPARPYVDAQHHVLLGDTLDGIAAAYGLLPDTIWLHDLNKELRSKRGDDRVLNPSDIVKIPPLRVTMVPVEAERRYVCRRRGVPSIFSVRFLHPSGAPRADLPYLLQIVSAGEPISDCSGSTDAEGFIRAPVPPNAIGGTVTLHGDQFPETYSFRLGYINPLSEISGVQARLNNIGYQCGREDGVMDEATIGALRAFQVEHGLEPTGTINHNTLAGLRAKYLL